MGLTERKLEKRVVQHYLGSKDYNGISLSQLVAELGAELDQLKGMAVALVKAGRISIVARRQSNPHIKMFDAPIHEQLHGLDEREPQFICLYPNRAAIEEEIAPADYDDRPFTQILVLGAPQLAALPFRIDVLDTYERDPRYQFRFYDFGGSISTHDEYYEQMDESDRFHLRFGVGYDEEGDRVVGVYLWDLGSLPARQQRIWKEFLIERECSMSEEYYKASLIAEFPDTMSVYEAIIHEQVEINKLFGLMGRAGLFRETYDNQRRPHGFSFFVKPTQDQYDSFVQLLDKMLSENINLDSLGDEVDRYRRTEIGPGEFERQLKGSIALLEDWLTHRYPGIEAPEVATAIDPLRKVRQLRQKPAHTIRKDRYDKRIYEMQDELVWQVYRGLDALRQLLISDHATSGYQLPSWDGQLTVKSY